MISHLKSALRRFGRSTEGSTSVEAAILFPALAVIFAACWVLFDVMRQHSISVKANYTLGDIISRETETLDAAYISNARNLLYHLTKSRDDDVDLRVTLIQYDQDAEDHAVIWSENRGDWDALTTSSLANYTDRIPLMADSDQLILVETRDAYEPIFKVPGIGSFDIETYSFTRPRFASQVIFEGANDGSGFVGGNDSDGDPTEDGT